MLADFQGIGAAPPGTDLVLYIGANIKTAECARIPELIELYHSQLFASMPGVDPVTYTAQMMEEDFKIGMCILLCGVARFSKFLEAIDDEHPIWGMAGAIFERFAQAADTMNLADFIKRVDTLVGQTKEAKSVFLGDVRVNNLF